MRILFRYLLLAIIGVAIFSCLSENSKDLAEISKNEAVFNEKHDSIKLALKMDILYKTFIRKYPSDTNIPRMLFEDAQLNISPLRRTEAAVNQLEELYTRYPDFSLSANAMFKAAFLDENVLGRTEQAKQLYLKFIDKYPKNPLVNDAKISVENISLSPAELLKKVQAQQDSLKNSAASNK